MIRDVAEAGAWLEGLINVERRPDWPYARLGLGPIRALLHRSLSSSYHIPGSPERAIEMHRLIFEAVDEQRPEEARQRMQEHVARVERDIAGART